MARPIIPEGTVLELGPGDLITVGVYIRPLDCYRTSAGVGSRLILEDLYREKGDRREPSPDRAAERFLRALQGEEETDG